MNPPAIALLAALLFAVVWSARRLVRVGDALDVDVDRLAVFVKRRPERVSLVAESLLGSRVAPLASALAASTARVAESNEALSDLSAELGWGETVPGAAIRIVILCTLFSAAWVVIARVDVGLRLLDVACLGGGGLMLVLSCKRAAAGLASRHRRALDAWVAASAPDEIAPTRERDPRPSRRRRT